MTEVFKVPSSKSLVNRYLILKQGHPELSIDWETKSLDVLCLSKALNSYKDTKNLYVGEGGTTLRFLVCFLSTQEGEWVIKGEPSLFKRPQEELFSAVKSLGCEVSKLSKSSVNIKGNGWSKDVIEMKALTTTQVLTGLILSALSSKKSLTILITEKGLNSDYLKLTKKFVESLGFFIKVDDKRIVIEGGQSPNFDGVLKSIESDWSTAAFLYVKAALFGDIELKGLYGESLQPDSSILKVLESSGALVSGFKLKKTQSYKPIDLNLQKSPDLFPVLSVFSCFCEGESRLWGAPQLTLKESNRIEKVSDLLTQCGYFVKVDEGGLTIKGEGFSVLEHKPFVFDVSSDHRIFMACELMKNFGYQIEMTGTESINKSFPEYLEWSV